MLRGKEAAAANRFGFRGLWKSREVKLRTTVMTTAAYYRMKAKEFFERALTAPNASEEAIWRERAREFLETAISLGADEQYRHG
jgi:hypothetical protein